MKLSTIYGRLPTALLRRVPKPRLMPAALSLSVLGSVVSACSGGSPSLVDPETAAAIGEDVKARQRPNIVVVVSDDHRWDLLSSRGHDFLHTPHLDAIASQGAVMENAFVPIALCSPSRGALLTGRNAHKASVPRIVWKNNSFLETQRTLAQEMQDAGYRTAYVGKWHLGEGSKPKPGFDHWESFDWLGSFFDPEIYINGKARKFEGYVDDVLSNRASRLISESDQHAKPLFMMVGLKAPHLKFEHPERHAEKFSDVDIPQPDTYHEDFSQSGKLQSIKDWLGMDNFHCGLNCFDYSWDTYIKSHYRAVLGIDDSIGRINRAVNASLRADNTLLIYTSDNGYSLGDHGLTEKHFVYEEPIRVPLLIDPPGQEALGRHHSELVSTIDIAPTVLDYADVEVPDSMTGLSLKPLLESSGTLTNWRDQLFFMYEKAQVAVRTDRYKLIRSLQEEGHYELYDLEADPRETQSVYESVEYAAVRADMHRRLQSIIDQNDWSPRKTYSVNEVLASNLMPSDVAHKVAQELSLSIGDPQQISEVDDERITWETLTVGGGQHPDRFILKQNPQDEQGLSRLVLLPIELHTDWDPFVEIRLRRRAAAYFYLNGDVSFTTVGERLPIDIANPPLQPGSNYLLMRFDDSAAMDVLLELEAPADTLSLPLEDERNLGDAPGRFTAVESWQPHRDVALLSSRDQLLMSSVGAEAQIVTENIHIDTATDGLVEVHIATEVVSDLATPLDLGFYWRQEGEVFDTDQSHQFTVGAGQQQHVITVDRGVVDALRLDLGTHNATLGIDSIAVRNLTGRVLQQWDFDQIAL